MTHYFHRKLAPLPKREIRIRIEEALKFLNMAVYCKGQIPVSKEIDEIWHYWILETKEYRKLCAVLQGGRFLHHSSNHYREFFDADNEPKEISLKRQVAMLATYVLNYGPFKKDRIKFWPLAFHLVNDRGWGMRRLNRWLCLRSV